MRRIDVYCKICGQPLRKYAGGTVYHCENKDLSHRGLIPADVVERAPRYLVKNQYGERQGFVTKKKMIEIVGRRAAAKAEKVAKILV